MKKFIILSIILIVTGCSSNDTIESRGTFVTTTPKYYITEPSLSQQASKKIITEDTVEKEYTLLGNANFYSSVDEAKVFALEGDSYACEYLVAYDFKNRVDWIIRGANFGSPVCMYQLGELYEYGNDLNLNMDAAISWYKKSAELNYGESFYKLGYFYLNGIGVEQYYPLAYDYLYKGAGLGNQNAMLSLAYMFEKGLGVEQSYNTAAKWYQLANTNDNVLTSLLNSNKKNIDIINIDKVSHSSYGTQNTSQIISKEFINIAKKYCIENNFDRLLKDYKSDYGLKENIITVNNKQQDGYYFDIDNDEKKEILSPIDDEIIILKQIESEYKEVDRFSVQPNKYGLVRFENKFYFLTKNNYAYENSPTEVTIYAFGENGVGETCKIIQEKTSAMENQKVVGSPSLDYYMTTILQNYKNKPIPTGTLFEDIDNNGSMEKINLNSISANNIESLFIDVYGYEDSTNTVLEKFLKEISNKNSIGRLSQLYIENIDGKNHIFLLYEGYNTYLYCYLLDNDVKMASNYIGYNLYNVKTEIEKY